MDAAWDTVVKSSLVSVSVHFWDGVPFRGETKLRVKKKKKKKNRAEGLMLEL